EFTVKTIPSTSKVRCCLESTYNFSVTDFRTLNIEDKKLRRHGAFLASRPYYKKALRHPLRSMCPPTSRPLPCRGGPQ
ncbi:Os03g0388366, partial [Oryza sativa Japonica Group]